MKDDQEDGRMSFDRFMRALCAGLFLGSLYLAYWGVSHGSAVATGAAGLLLVVSAWGAYEANDAMVRAADPRLEPRTYPFEAPTFAPRWTTVTSDAGLADAFRSKHAIFQPHDLVMVERTGEMLLVRDATLGLVEVVRGMGYTHPVEIKAGDELCIVGSAEG